MRDTFAAQWLRHLAREEGIFQNPPHPGTHLNEIFANLLPTVSLEKVTEPQEWPETLTYHYGCEGFQFDVYISPIRVWLDISENEPGRGGSAVYSGIASFAFTTRRQFIGDPDGLSLLALRRRTDAMLCSALKHGTTDHLAPHAYQIEGDAENGVPALVWESGNTLGNIQSMIETGVTSLAHCVPEIRNASFCFDTRTFKDFEGRQLLDTALADWGTQLARGGTARAGNATFKRSILLQSLVRQESGTRPALLEQVLREPSQFLETFELSGIFY